jgi:RNA polymerase sigma-70 factor (ECF subfamily)
MLKRTNEQWIDALHGDSPDQPAALADLHQIILEGLPYALNKWLSPDDPRFQPMAEEVAQETLLRVLDHLDSFEGRSQFTTWVYKIAVRVALTELRHKRWKNVSLDELVEAVDKSPVERLMADSAPSPERIVEGADIMARVQRIIDEELTEKQHQAMMAIAVHSMPLEEIARRQGTNRNALYKLLHDTRLRIKRRLAQEGLTPEDLLAMFAKE